MTTENGLTVKEDYTKSLEYFDKYGGIKELDPKYLYSQLRRGIQQALVVHGKQEKESESWANKLLFHYLVNH